MKIWPFFVLPPPAPLIILVHIPKTGGTTLAEILRAVYGRQLLEARPPFGFRQEWPQELRAKAKRRHWRAFAGHTAYGIHALFERPAIYLSSVREPFERFQSYYKYVRREPIHHYHKLAQTLCIGEFYRKQKEIQDPELYNFQCQLLCGRKDFATAKEFAATRYLAIVPLSMFDSSIEWVRARFGWPAIEIPRLNRSEDDELIADLTEADRREFVQSNQADADLVKFCEEQMASRLDRDRGDDVIIPVVMPPTIDKEWASASQRSQTPSRPNT